MNFPEEINYKRPEFGKIYDELPLGSTPLGLLILECAPLKRGVTILDAGAGTGFLFIELAQR
jgi:2-polyprenyl-3-methyl-5-hydroxy-6-metoxy-1,4-benzoquinol methylase